MALPRVLLVAENVSARLGGEAFLPLHYFRVLRARGAECYLLTHERVRDELVASFPNDVERMDFLPDTPSQALLWKLGEGLPRRIETTTLGAVRQSILHAMLRKRAKQLVHDLRIDVVHQPTPVSPRRPSGLYDLGAPVVIGPLNGNMYYPPAFASESGRVAQALTLVGRKASGLANRLSPGKLKAATLLVANERTRAGLPSCLAGVPVVDLVENGVDLGRFGPGRVRTNRTDAMKMVFVGRLVDWKAVDLLLEAMARVSAPGRVELHVLGDGVERSKLERMATELGLDNRVVFHGFVEQADVARLLDEMDVLVLPSLFECGGAVVLEAMAKGLPVIASNWGGPADYLDASCGILVDPDGRESFIEGLSGAIAKLAQSPELRERMGQAGRKRAEADFDWERKVDRILEVYEDAIARASPASQRRRA